MTVHFEIPFSVIEFACHFFAGISYVFSGIALNDLKNTDSMLPGGLLLLAIILTGIGAHL